ncbi:hypothetical protein SEUCBS140593_010318 [Sporothrix eucalyptigena]|uniref:Phytanoyl-CoA hydroxylase n=1 Tax=Sporothrix eucalyptigena TaxID=1812306 RepID=A0ABP0D1K7_9PEZI
MAQVLSPQPAHNLPTPVSNRTSIAAESNQLNLDGYAGAIENVQLLEPLSPDTPVEELRRRYKEDGVIWVKGLLDSATVKKFRGDYLAFVNDGTGLLKEGTDPVEGIFSGQPWQNFLLPGAVRRALGLSDDGLFVERAIASHQSDTYQDFKNGVGRALEPFVGRLGDFKYSWCLPRSLLRLSVPGGNVDVHGGGLIYLDKSHEIGRKFEKDFDELNANLSDEQRISAFNENMMAGGWLDRNAAKFGKHWGRRWLVGKYEAGDVVFHSPYMVHAGAKNEDCQNRIRVSTDLRFVDKMKPYDERWTYLAYSPDDPNVAKEKK